jgi:hypothetical protein
MKLPITPNTNNFQISFTTKGSVENYTQEHYVHREIGAVKTEYGNFPVYEVNTKLVFLTGYEGPTSYTTALLCHKEPQSEVCTRGSSKEVVSDLAKPVYKYAVICNQAYKVEVGKEVSHEFLPLLNNFEEYAKSVVLQEVEVTKHYEYVDVPNNIFDFCSSDNIG